MDEIKRAKGRNVNNFKDDEDDFGMIKIKSYPKFKGTKSRYCGKKWNTIENQQFY